MASVARHLSLAYPSLAHQQGRGRESTLEPIPVPGEGLARLLLPSFPPTLFLCTAGSGNKRCLFPHSPPRRAPAKDSAPQLCARRGTRVHHDQDGAGLLPAPLWRSVIGENHRRAWHQLRGHWLGVASGPQHGTAWRGTARLKVTWHGTARLVVTWWPWGYWSQGHGMAQLGMAWLEVTWHGTAQHSVARCCHQHPAAPRPHRVPRCRGRAAPPQALLTWLTSPLGIHTLEHLEKQMVLLQPRRRAARPLPSWGSPSLRPHPLQTLGLEKSSLPHGSPTPSRVPMLRGQSCHLCSTSPWWHTPGVPMPGGTG